MAKKDRIGDYLEKILDVLFLEQESNLQEHLADELSATAVSKVLSAIEDLPLSKLPLLEEQAVEKKQRSNQVEKLMRQISQLLQTLEMARQNSKEYRQSMERLQEILSLYNQLRRNKKRLIRYLENLSPQVETSAKNILEQMDVTPIDGEALFTSTLTSLDLVSPIVEEERIRMIRFLKEIDWREIPLQGKQKLATEADFEVIKKKLMS